MASVNSSSNNNETLSELKDLSHEFITSIQVAIIVVAISGLFGNTLTMLAIIKNKKLQTAGNLFIFKLSITDSLYFTVDLPMRFAMLQVPDHDWNDRFCLFQATTGHFLFGMSLTCLMAIAANRLVQIVFTSHYGTWYSKRKMPLHICGIWCVPATLTVLLPAAGIYGHLSYQRELYTCAFTPGVDEKYPDLLSGSAVFIPCVFIIFCYTYIYLFVRAQKRRLRGWKGRPTNNVAPVNSTSEQSTLSPISSLEVEGLTQELASRSQILLTTSSVSPALASYQSTSFNMFSGRRGPQSFQENVPKTRTKQGDSQRREAQKMAVMMVCIFVILVICVCPYFLLQLLTEDEMDPVWYWFSLSTSWLNGCANPIIYALMNLKFRAAYRNILFK